MSINLNKSKLKPLISFVFVVGSLFFFPFARAEMVDFSMKTEACVGGKCESCDALKGVCSGSQQTSEYCMGGCGGEESLISYLRPWHLGHYFYTPPKLSYNYGSTFYVFRNNIWIPLADVCWTVHPGEQVKAELDKTGEWIGQPGLFWDTPPVHFKDTFDWTGVDGCRQEDDMGTADVSNFKIGWGKQIGIDRNQLMAPTIFKNPLVTLTAAGFQCQGNICTAPSQTGNYNLTNTASATEARQHYWDYDPLAGAWSFNGLKGCIPKHAYSGVGVINGVITNPTIFGYTGSLDSPELTSNPSWLSANKVTERYNGKDYQLSVVESLAKVPEWTKVQPISVKTPEEDLCPIVCPIDGTCPPGTNPNCPGCCGQDGVCNVNCPYDPDCCVDPYCLPYCPGYGYPHCVISAGSCVVIRTKPSMDVTKVNTLDEVKYQAQVLGGDNPIGYTWFCDKNASASQKHTVATRTDEQTCSYDKEGTYEPKVFYDYKTSDGNVRSQECLNTQEIGLTVSRGEISANSCSIELSSNKAEKGDTVTATIKPVPNETNLNNYTITWKINGIAQPTHNPSISKQLNSVGTTSVEASIKNKAGNVVNCGQTGINVTETIRWGQ